MRDGVTGEERDRTTALERENKKLRCARAKSVGPRGYHRGPLHCGARRAPWKTKESLELATLEWVSWFNHHRLLEPIGHIPPVEVEANYYAQLAEKSETPVSL